MQPNQRTTAAAVATPRIGRILGGDARLAANDETPAAALARSLAEAPAIVRDAQQAAYIKLLNSHDWSHEYSDDYSVVQRGRASFAELRMVQRLIDPDFTVWNAHCHPRWANGRECA